MSKKSKIEVGEVTAHIVSWLRDYADNAKMKGFVIGVSGGIDSAVTSTLCARTGLPTLCVELPIHQHSSHVERKKEHISFLKSKFSNVSSITVDLSALFDDFKESMPKIDNEATLHLALANSRARLRMITLYYLAGINGYLVAGTGNKIEDFGVGFFTKYGDGGVDLSPIADLMKSEVYALAAYLEVPKSIQEAAPTDGLFGDTRTDEDQLGASYDELEWAMEQVENNKTKEDFTGRERAIFEIYTRLHAVNQHKMKPIPVCIISKK